ncbi:metal ABC transporter solute-binding protein, Zn/Mn family [Williamsia sp. CHRR-6]|uniref:metal ABC transporter solute-binding protein, Zn/Mn family n=1 Tax=Williamsia sp. CHRR-6 TaxID=2835871 RepID=UPI001BDB261F|nr:zinc ABC transporter substrate-binding protein [Williamsia sp. CHRR-6]MBT0566009.1 zinc ABC transporter substrate-binding protein [Williamsia sp. CHRR-6]
MSSRRLPLLSAVVTVTVGASILSGCSNSDGDGTSGGKVSVVTSTDVWASVATAVAGDKATVQALYTSPDGDPHEFEPTAKDTAKVSDAGIVVLNGNDYDPYMEKAPKGQRATVINAFDVYKSSGGDGSTKAGEVNEHFFYNLSVVGKVAGQIADALGKKDSDNAATYTANAKAFTDKLDALQTKLAAVKAAHAGDKVAQTEPLAAYLLADAGLTDATPSAFTDAVEAGQDPPASAIATTEDLINKKTVKALLYNTQAVDETTKRLLASTATVGLPVVKLTETLPAGVTDYVAWQTANVDAIAAAVNK